MPESMAGTNRDRAHQIISGKLTDHQRPNGSPFATIETTSSSYTCYTTIQSPLILSEEEEEEDMANCLIMLAHSVSVSPNQVETISTKSSSDNYECKTCNRSFQSFQALGGHRASHKKTKLTVQETTNSVLKQKLVHDNKMITHNIIKSSSPPPGFIQTGYKLINSNGKVHECSICGSEFLSGQALGGHMRRHRTTPPSTNQMNYTSSHQNTENSRVLCLDLNLPAPEVVEDVHSVFGSSQQPLGFSTTALVDCHY